ASDRRREARRLLLKTLRCDGGEERTALTTLQTLLDRAALAMARASCLRNMPLLQPFLDIWRKRELFRAILTRELQVRFRGSVFGWAWAILAPLAMLSVYTLVFSGALRIDAARQESGRFGYAFSIFVGLVVFNYFSEIAYRSPLLL